MLTAEGCRKRQSRLWDSVPDSIDWLLIADPRHIHYLSNFWVNPISFSSHERSLLLLERDGTSTLLADNFTRRSAAGTPYVDNELIESWYDHQHSVTNRNQVLDKLIQSILLKVSGRPGALEQDSLSVSVSRLIESKCEVAPNVQLSSTLRNLRRQKEPDEIALLQQCMKAGDAGHAAGREAVTAGASEFEVYQAIQTAALAAVGRPAIVYGDFRAVNANTPKAGGLPTDYVLKDGDLMILDFSVVIDGYRSDFTNTVAVATPTDEQTRLFEFCCEAIERGESSLKPNVNARDVYAATSSALEEAGYGPLRHHAGHGIGLAHPEPPILVPESDDSLVEHDVITLEPGLYVAGIGGMRFEHNYLITDTGYQRLSNHVLALK